jgi:hypothetical protein
MEEGNDEGKLLSSWQMGSKERYICTVVGRLLLLPPYFIYVFMCVCKYVFMYLFVYLYIYLLICDTGEGTQGSHTY